MTDSQQPDVRPKVNPVRHRLKQLLIVISAAVSLPMIFLVVVRIARIEDTRVVVLLETFTPYLLLPAYGIAVFALLARVRSLALMAMFLVVCHVGWVVVPEWRPAARQPSGIENAPSLSILSQNILYENRNPEDIAKTIDRLDPDVVFFQEAARKPVRAIEETGALDRYEHRFIEPEDGPAAIGIWSKLPLKERQTVLTNAFPALRSVVEVNERPVVLWNIHTRPPPLEMGTVEEWQGDLRAVKEYLHSEDGNVIAAGDFNAVYSHRPYRDIIDNGYVDAHISLGRGIARTWPAYGRPGNFGGAIRIDHLLTRGDARATTIEETPGFGSDHRGLYSRIALQ